MRGRGRTAGCAAVALLAAACSTAPPPVDPSLRAAVQEDALRVYSRALVWSPEDGDTSAPLFIVEQPDETPPGGERSIELKLDVEQIEHAELPLTQREYRWSFSDGSAGAMRGLYGEDGYALLYEILEDSRAVRRVFVSTELESDAAMEFGALPAGRRFAVERSAGEGGRTVIAGTFESGSMPLGPIVYLDAGQRDVTAVICRCMPSQLSSVDDARRYTVETVKEVAVFDLESYSERLRLPTALSLPPRRR